MKKIEIRTEWLEAIADFPAELQANIILAMTKYIAFGEVPADNTILIATALMRHQVDADRLRREQARLKREEAKQQGAESETPAKPKGRKGTTKQPESAPYKRAKAATLLLTHLLKQERKKIQRATPTAGGIAAMTAIGGHRV